MSNTQPVLLITGGSRGIGAATAKLAAQRGYAVAINYVKDKSAAEKVVAKIKTEGGDAQAFCANVSDWSQVQTLFTSVNEVFGTVTALVNNAGIAGGFSTIVDTTPEKLNRVFSTNLFSGFFCIRLAVDQMAYSKGGKGGVIVNVSSQAAIQGGNLLSAYAASKAGVNTLTIAAARELATEGIRVNAVSPGIIETDQQLNLSPERRIALEQSLPLGRMGQPKEVAATILWLLSKEASYVTGTIIPVTGGR
jgi:NAD(P)-dependent dehydrogenase (short-subunit alcohol dehydrogenase family)